MKAVRISQVDALFANGSYPIEMLFYYREAFSTKRLRRALRRLSTLFWPVCGEYRDGVIAFDRYREEALFDEKAEDRALDIADLEGAGAEVISRYGLPELKRLFFLKVTRFTNGLVLVPTMNHLAGDGYSYFFFLSALAALARPSYIPLKPFFIRAMFKPHHRRTALKDFALGSVNVPSIPSSERLTVEFEAIPRMEVRSMVRQAAAASGLNLSSNDVLSAMALKKLAGLPSGAAGDDFDLTMPIDIRRQVAAYGPRFFGNGIMLHTAGFSRTTAEGVSLEGAAARIRRSMPVLSSENYIRYLASLEEMIAEKRWERFRPFDPARGCLVTNLSKMPAERLDFGTGRPAAIVPLTIERNSAAIMARGENFVLRYAY
jgi:Transferase family